MATMQRDTTEAEPLQLDRLTHLLANQDEDTIARILDTFLDRRAPILYSIRGTIRDLYEAAEMERGRKRREAAIRAIESRDRQELAHA